MVLLIRHCGIVKHLSYSSFSVWMLLFIRLRGTLVAYPSFFLRVHIDHLGRRIIALYKAGTYMSPKGSPRLRISSLDLTLTRERGNGWSSVGPVIHSTGFLQYNEIHDFRTGLICLYEWTGTTFVLTNIGLHLAEEKYKNDVLFLCILLLLDVVASSYFYFPRPLNISFVLDTALPFYRPDVYRTLVRYFTVISFSSIVRLLPVDITFHLVAILP